MLEKASVASLAVAGLFALLPTPACAETRGRPAPQARAGAPLYDHPAVSRSYFFPRRNRSLPEGNRSEAVTLKTDVRLHAFWHRPLDGAPTVLYLHGNGETVGDQGRWLDWSRQIGANVMLVDYPGYGMSQGAPSCSGCCRAARAALDFLVAQPVDKVPAVIAMGRSAGSIFALDAAAACRSPRLRGLVLESGVADVMQ